LHLHGAPSSRLVEYSEQYSKKLEPAVPSHQLVNGTNWKEFLGQERFYSDYVDFFRGELGQKGIPQTMQEYIPILAPSVSCSAFHPVITLGYGLEIQDLDNIAEGLAYWCFTYRSHGTLSDPKHSKDPAKEPPLALLDQVRAENDLIGFPLHLRFQQKMNLLVEKYQHILQKYDITLHSLVCSGSVPMLLEIFSKTIVEVFAYSGCKDFFLLHGITSFRAVKKVVLELGDNLEAKIDLLRHFWRGVVATFISQGSPHMRAPLAASLFLENKDWNALIEKANQSTDEHVIKLAFVCHAEDEEHPDPLYYYTAYTTVHIKEDEKQDWNY
jgi:hypothetical protein